MGSTVASECLLEHMTALTPLSYQFVTASLRLIAEVLGLGLLHADTTRSGPGAPVPRCGQQTGIRRTTLYAALVRLFSARHAGRPFGSDRHDRMAARRVTAPDR